MAVSAEGWYFMASGARSKSATMCLSRSRLLLVFCIALCAIPCSSDRVEELNVDKTSTADNETNSQKARDRTEAAEMRRRLLDENADWGTFYDPKNIFCGKYDCYKILGFDHETFYKKKPSTKEITQSYRALSRAWHPDKNKRKGAKERFVKIARAYEVLTNDETRKEYDHYRDRPDEYFEKYGSSVLWSYAPKSDARFIIVMLLAFFSLLSVYIKKQRWKQVAAHVTKAAVEGWGLKEGGSTESMDIRKQALEILTEREEQQKDKTETVASDTSDTKRKSGKKGSGKGKDREKKKADQEELRKIIEQLVGEIDDFGGGFRKPTARDLFIVQLVLLPWSVAQSVAWCCRYWVRRGRRLDYSDEELEYFTRNAVGNVLWDCATEEEREEMKTKELWKQGNLEEWKEELETKNLSAGDQKRYKRWKKKEGGKGEKDE